jgi:hypothetical protein
LILPPNLASKLGFKETPQASHFRFKSAPGERTPFITEFASNLDKQAFLNNYYKIGKSLKLSMFGGTDDSRIYVAHDLSKSQYAINKAAFKMKKDGDISAMRIDHGYVMVRTPDDPAWYKYTTVKELENDVKKKKERKNKKAPTQPTQPTTAKE